MAQIKVKPQDFGTAAKKFDDAVDQCTKIQAKIKNESEELLKTWKGKSSEAFRVEYNQLYKSMFNYKEDLKAISKDLQQIAKSYEEADKKLKETNKVTIVSTGTTGAVAVSTSSKEKAVATQKTDAAKKTEVDKGKIISSNEIEKYIGSNKQLTEKQKKAIRKINEYSNHAQVKSSLKNGETIVLFFEGAGDEGKNAVEIHGSEYSKRYNAACIILQHGKIAYFTGDASTLPDHPKKGDKANDGTDVAVTKPGVYRYSQVQHGSRKYPAIDIFNDKDADGKHDYNGKEGVPVARFGDKSWYDSTSEGIHGHYGGKDKSNDSPKDSDKPSGGKYWAWSTGCLTVEPTSYNGFAKATGIDKDGKIENYEKADRASGTLIVDRSLMNENDPNLIKIFGKDGLKKIK